MSDIPLSDLIRARRQSLTDAAALTTVAGATGPAGVPGAAGVSIVSANVASGNLIITLSDANVVNAGAIATGTRGATGLTGNVGATGPIGLTGNVGATGPIGLTGNIGLTGATGLTGNVGATGPSETANVFVFYLTSNVRSVTGPAPVGGFLPVFGANSNVFLNAGRYDIEALVCFKKLESDGYVQFALKSDGTAELVGQMIGENSGNIVTGFRSTSITSYWPQTRILTASGTETYECIIKGSLRIYTRAKVYLFPVINSGSISTESGSYLKITQLPDNTSSIFEI